MGGSAGGDWTVQDQRYWAEVLDKEKRLRGTWQQVYGAYPQFASDGGMRKGPSESSPSTPPEELGTRISLRTGLWKVAPLAAGQSHRRRQLAPLSAYERSLLDSRQRGAHRDGAGSTPVVRDGAAPGERPGNVAAASGAIDSTRCGKQLGTGKRRPSCSAFAGAAGQPSAAIATSIHDALPFGAQGARSRGVLRLQRASKELRHVRASRKKMEAKLTALSAAL